MPDEPDVNPPDVDAGPVNDEPLGPAGQKALDAMKAELKEARAEARKARTLEADLAKMREANQSEAEKALDAARKEGVDEAHRTIGAQLAQANLELAVLRTVGTRFADPADAMRFLNADDVSTDGHVNEKALTAAVDELLDAKPYLAANARLTVTADQGPRGNGPTGKDMNDLIRQAAGRA